MSSAGDGNYDAGEVEADIKRIREKLRRLDDERQSTVSDLEKAMRSVNKRLGDQTRPEGTEPSE